MDKSCDEALQAPIQRIFYLSAGGGPCRGLNQAGESSVLQYLGTAAVHCSPFHLPCCEEPPWHAVLNPALPTGRPRCVKQVVSAPLPSVAHGPPMAPPPAAEGDTHEPEVAPACEGLRDIATLPVDRSARTTSVHAASRERKAAERADG